MVGWSLLLGAVVAALGAIPAAAQPTGDAGRGGALFAAKECARCHRPRGEPEGGGPPLEELRRAQGAFQLAGRLWNHAPSMFAAFGKDGLKWPEIGPAEMGNLMAYLQADLSRDPAPDPFKGGALLVRKGCLKCHGLRGEGARVAPDLGQRRASYDSAVAWAAAMWGHTPPMAARARELGIAYPRFTEYELGDLVGYLRTIAR